MPLFWLTYRYPKGRVVRYPSGRVAGVVVIESGDLLDARLKASLSGADRELDHHGITVKVHLQVDRLKADLRQGIRHRLGVAPGIRQESRGAVFGVANHHAIRRSADAAN